MQKHIHKYIRNRKGEVVGIVMGTKLEMGDVVITTSKAAVSKGDVFDKDFGKHLCIERAKRFENEGRKNYVAESMFDESEAFAKRCERYFKVESCYIPEIFPPKKDSFSGPRYLTK